MSDAPHNHTSGDGVEERLARVEESVEYISETTERIDEKLDEKPSREEFEQVVAVASENEEVLEDHQFAYRLARLMAIVGGTVLGTGTFISLFEYVFF